jgi:hypothetical protein
MWRTLWERIRHFFERQHALLSGIYYLSFIGGGLLGLFTWLIGFANKSDKSNATPAEPPGLHWVPDSVSSFVLQHRWPLSAMSLIIVFGALAVQIASEKRKWRRISYLLDELSREYYELLSELRDFSRASIESRVSAAAYLLGVQAMSAKLDRFLSRSANTISKIFSVYCSRPCHVALKLFDASAGRVKTVVRDESSLVNRASIDETLQWYPYVDNTAFEQILDMPDKSSFISNHLRWLNCRKKYKNSHQNWQQYYRATTVVPVTIRTHGGAITKETTWGFLTVDSVSGKFDRNSCTNLLWSFARMYYFVFVTTAPIIGRSPHDGH